MLDYIVENQSLERAEKVQDEVLSAITKLEEMPTAHAPVRETYELIGDTFRRILADRYRIIFTIEEAN